MMMNIQRCMVPTKEKGCEDQVERYEERQPRSIDGKVEEELGDSENAKKGRNERAQQRRVGT